MTESDCKEAKLTGGGMMMAGLVGVSGEDKGGGGDAREEFCTGAWANKGRERRVGQGRGALIGTRSIATCLLPGKTKSTLAHDVAPAQ